MESQGKSELPPELPDEEIREKLLFPHLKPIMELLEKEFDGTGMEMDSEEKKAMEDVLYGFIEQRIERAGIYRSERHEAAFPWGVTDTADLYISDGLVHFSNF